MFRFSLTDVRRRIGLADYAGELQASRRCAHRQEQRPAAGTDPATVTDSTCRSRSLHADSGLQPSGATCAVTTTLDAVTPGMVREGARAVWELRQVEVIDGGPDGDVDTPGNAVFARQGVFVP